MTDVIERLRFIMPSSLNDAIRTMEEAAQEIERMRKALRWMANNPGGHPSNIKAIALDALGDVGNSLPSTSSLSGDGK